MLEQEQINKHVEYVADKMPCALYWLDLNYIVIGVNERLLKAIGANSRDDIIGKNVYDFYPKHVADSLQLDFKTAVETGKDLEREHVIEDITTGKTRYFAATVSALRDSNQAIIGIIGTSIEITSEKEKEQLEIENQAHMIRAEADDKFRKVVRQLSHDINAPISSINNMVSRLSNTIPENERITLRNASERIAGISQKLLSKYDKPEEDDNEVFLVLLALTQIINERREDHRNTGVTIELNLDPDDDKCKFSCIKHNPGVFKRMISNLIKNAVEALKDTLNAKVSIEYGAVGKKIAIIIEDNGPGMPKHIQEMFMDGIEITEGKEHGNGIGLTQVRDAIITGGGTYKVYASGNGTIISMWFPIVDTPYWIEPEIKLIRDDTVIILDDDPSIHGSWDSSFAESLAENPTLKIKHFSDGHEAVKYINSLTPEQKQDIFLLTDYELLDQNINGLDVVRQTNILRAILVTSHSGQKDMQNAVIEAGIKMLPKELAADAKIIVNKKIPIGSNAVDIVWVEDQKFLVDDIVSRYYNHLKVDIYYNPIKFMENVHQYPLNTRIILDTYYEADNGTIYMMTGFDLARQLHAMGFTKLIIYAGEEPKSPPPEYLKVVIKGLIDADKILGEI